MRTTKRITNTVNIVFFFFFQSHIQLHCVQLTILFESSFFIISKIHLNSHYHSHNVKNHLGFYSFAFLFLFPFCFCSSVIYFFIFFLLTYFLFLFQLALQQLTALFNDLYENAYITTYTYIFYTEIALILFS